jgi:hypothetical protein
MLLEGRRIGAQSDVFARQKLHADILEGALDGIPGCRIELLTLQLEVVNGILADRRGTCQLANRLAQQGTRRTALGGGNHNLLVLPPWCRQTPFRHIYRTSATSERCADHRTAATLQTLNQPDITDLILASSLKVKFSIKSKRLTIRDTT